MKPAWLSLICGDNIPGPNEQCDSGRPNDFCTSRCRSRDARAVLDPAANASPAAKFKLQGSGNAVALGASVSSLVDSSAAPNRSFYQAGGRYLSEGPHPIAAGDAGFAVTYVDYTDDTAVRIALYQPDGDRLGVYTLGEPGEAVDFSSPVVAALPDQKFAVAWVAFNGDSANLGIHLQLVDLEQGPVGAPLVANGTTVSSQYDPDILWTGSQLVVAWTDESDPTTGPDLRVRTFSQGLSPLSGEEALAATPNVEGNVSLAPFGQGFAAAWRQGEADGHESIQVSAGGATLQVSDLLGGAMGDQPTLVELDSTHLLLSFTYGTDPENSGLYNTGRLAYAIVDTAGPSELAWNPLQPIVAPYSSDATIAQSQPSAMRTADEIFLAWHSAAVPGDALQDEVWLKTLKWDADQATLDTSKVEQPLPISELHRGGDQRVPRLAPSPSFPQGGVLAAWVDYGKNVEGESAPDIVTNLRGLLPEVCLNYEQQSTPPFALGMLEPPDGSAQHPYPICNVDQLSYVAQTADLQSKSFILEADLDLTDFSGALGHVAPFTGTFDGNDHTLANFRSEQPSANGVGFVEQLQGDGVLDGSADGAIANLTLLDPIVHGAADVGAVVGATLANGSLQNVHVSGGSVTAEGSRVGGIAGSFAGPLTDATASANVTSTGVPALAGGLVGAVTATGSLENAAASGNVTAADSDVGGLVGQNLGSIFRASATGAVSGSLRVGGLVGSSSGAITDSYARGAVSGTRAGGLIGQGESGSSIARSYAAGAVTGPSELGALAGFADPGSTFAATVWDTTTHAGMSALGNQPTPPSGVLGKTTFQMQLRATYLALGWDFVQVWGIYEGQDYPIHQTGSYDFCSVVPQQSTPPFSAGFPADGSAGAPYPLCTMAQLQQVASTTSLYSKHFILMGDIDLTGLTGTIGTSGVTFTGAFDGNGHTLSNYTLQSPNSYAALFGRVDAPGTVPIKNLTVEGFNVAGKGYVGAVVGELLSGSLEDIHVVGSVVSQQGATVQHAGGLVARAHGSVNRCTSSATVSAVYLNVGGLVGTLEATGSVADSSSTGSVLFTHGTTHSSAYAGGLVGRVYGSVSDSFSNAVVQTDRIVAGGLVGTCIGGSITGSYATGSVTATGTSGGLLGRGDAATVSGSWATGSVTSTDANGEAGGLVGELLNGSLVRDSAATGAVTGTNTVGGLVGLSNACAIETSSASGAVVASDQYSGGLAGRIINGTLIQACDASGSVTGVAYTGGLVGSASTSTSYDTITASHATGNVLGDLKTGGLVGLGQNVDISTSWASGAVSSLPTATRIGGLVGSLEYASTVANTYATGNVTVGTDLGGALVGYMSSTSAVSNSYALGTVTGNGTKGALIGIRSADTTCTASLFSTTANPTLLGIGSGTNTGALGYDDTALEQQATYANQGWDFVTVWTIDEGVGYARLR